MTTEARTDTRCSPLRRIGAATAIALTLLGSPLAHSQGVRFATTTLQAGMHLIQAEVADDTPRRMQGLMFRRDLPGNQGMVFVFERPSPQCMWMKNTLIPLSVAFIDADRKIVNIEDMQPQTETNHCAASDALYALEMSQGWFKRKGIRAGDRIDGLEKLTGRQ